ncbi:MAG: GHKL domain-containing protein [Hespellia sp.]|nr:GHKL domain-containing protein [Hespellia sp.]
MRKNSWNLVSIIGKKMQIIFVVLFIVEFFKYYLGMKIFFEINLKNKILIGGFLIGYIVFISICDWNTVEKRLLMYGLLMLLFVLVSEAKRITLMTAFFVITSLDEIADGILGVLNEYWIHSSLIKENMTLISSLMILIIIVVVYICKKFEWFGWKTRLYLWAKKHVGFFVILMALQLVFTICSLNYAKAYIPNSKFYLFATLLSITALLCIVFLIPFVLYMKNLNIRLEEVIAIEQRMKRLQKDYYETLLSRDKDTQKYRHDLNGHLLCLSELAKEDQAHQVLTYIETLQEKLGSIQKKSYWTGNNIIDVLLNYYVPLLVGNVKVQISGQCNHDINISQTDLCIIFFNLLQNAVEALNNMGDERTKYLQILIKQDSAFFHCQIKNTIRNFIDLSKDSIGTTKKDKVRHGFGIENAKETVKKNNGLLTLETQNEWFICRLMLKSQPIKEKTDR